MTVVRGAPKDCPTTPRRVLIEPRPDRRLEEGDAFDLLHGQSTLNECGDYGVVVPTPEPKTCGAAVRPDNKDVLTIDLHRDDVTELGVPLGSSRQDGDEFHSILSD